MTIRRLRLEDLEEVSAREAAEGDTRWSRVQFEKELVLPQSRFYVLVCQEGIAGYGGFWIVESEAQITNLLIRRTYRKQGLGEDLLQHLVREAKQSGCARMTLEVRINNAAARTLYENSGFVMTGCRPRAYTNPEEDAVLMEKQLNAER